MQRVSHDCQGGRPRGARAGGQAHAPRAAKSSSRCQPRTPRRPRRRRGLAAAGSPGGEALALLEQDLRAPRRRAAHAPRLRASTRAVRALGRRRRDSTRPSVAPRQVRRYVAQLTERGAAPSTSARKLAALRALFASQREHGADRAEPRRPRLHAAPRRAPAAGAERARGARAARRDPRASGPLRAARPRDVRAGLLLRAARRGAGLAAVGDVDHDGEQLRVEGKGRKTRFVPVGEPAMAALRDYLERARPALARRAPRGAGGRHDGAGAARGRDALFLSRSGRRWHQRRAPAAARWTRARASPARPRRTRCATASRRTCSTAAPTCAASRSCSATRACPAPRFTLG